MTARMRETQVWSHIERVLKNETVAVKGEIACIDTADGALVPVSTATTLIPIGYFKDDLTGDGTKKARVEFFEQKTLQLFANATSTDAVADANVGGLCYLKDGGTVTITATGRSVAGTVWNVAASGLNKGVLVEIGKSYDLVDTTA